MSIIGGLDERGGHWVPLVGAPWLVRPTSCTGSPCVITGLTNGTAYTFKVSNTNGVEVSLR